MMGWIFLAGAALAAPAEVVVEKGTVTPAEVRSPHWLEHQGGTHGNDVRSPDGLWHLALIPDSDLDVMTFRVRLRSSKGVVMDLCSQALDAMFSPDSQSVFVSTGPNPFIYRLNPPHRVMLADIQSGLENYPVWVSSWSADGHHLVLHQQKRFDDRNDPKVWNVTLP
jgi:hypothetical protein